MLTVKVKSSRYLTIFFSIIYCGAIAILLQSALVIFIKLAGIIICLIAFSYCLGRNHCFYLPNTATQLWRAKEGHWLVLTRDGKLYQGELLGDSYISSLLLILNFRLLNPKKKISVLLAADTLSQDEFRRLKVALQTQAIVPKQYSNRV